MTVSMSRIIIVLSSWCLFHNVESKARIDPLVDTKVGLIKGLTSSNGEYSMFMGIPYGIVNASNPFGVAKKYPKFEKTFEAYEDIPACPQFNRTSRSIVGSLDCLRLNIYVPSTATSENKLPIMIWIHGGSFQTGSGGRDFVGPENIVRHDVILVTLNYRLGLYGFMCLDIPEVPGNQGLKDQYMAIKWVHDNLEAFGGDINNIALFGVSAGGHSIEFQLRSKKKDLFKKVILETGSAVSATVLVEPDKKSLIKLAEHLNHSTSNIHEALKFLAESDPEVAIGAYNALSMTFKPCVEKKFDGVDNFLTTTWINTPVPKVKNVPVLMGFNNQEFITTFFRNGAISYYQKHDIVKENLQKAFRFSKKRLVEMTDLVRHYYLGDEPITEIMEWPIINFGSDFTYIHPIQRSMKKFIESGAANIYYYMFSYSGGRNTGKYANNVTETGGAGHSDEIGYLFNMASLPNKPTAADQLIIDRMTTMWTNFAKYSDPTPKTTELLPVKWTPVTSEMLHCMQINDTLTMSGRPVHERMAFWDLFFKVNERWLKTFDD